MRDVSVSGTKALPESTGRHTFKETTVYAHGLDNAEPVKLKLLEHGDCCCGKEHAK